MKTNFLVILDETIEDCRKNPIGLLNINDLDGEYRYISNSKPSYVRTINDIISYFDQIGTSDYSRIRVLEIGSFLGIVSIVLSKIGFSVTALDIPEFMRNERLLAKYDRNNVEYISLNLRHYKIPLESRYFDAIIMCETLEHLNFNPLPAIVEINRILKNKGLLYLSSPNIARFHNRINLLFGKSIHDPIGHFFAQLDKNDNMIVGLHWREYTDSEIKEMLERLGFEIIKQRFFHWTDLPTSLTLKVSMMKSIFSIFPKLKANQTTLARKKEEPSVSFYFCEANR